MFTFYLWKWIRTLNVLLGWWVVSSSSKISKFCLNVSAQLCLAQGSCLHMCQDFKHTILTRDIALRHSSWTDLSRHLSFLIQLISKRDRRVLPGVKCFPRIYHFPFTTGDKKNITHDQVSLVIWSRVSHRYEFVCRFNSAPGCFGSNWC